MKVSPFLPIIVASNIPVIALHTLRTRFTVSEIFHRIYFAANTKTHLFLLLLRDAGLQQAPSEIC